MNKNFIQIKRIFLKFTKFDSHSIASTFWWMEKVRKNSFYELSTK